MVRLSASLPVRICASLWALLLVMALCTSVQAEEGKGTLTVSLNGFRDDNGMAMVSLYRTEVGFPFDAALAARKEGVLIVGGKAAVVFRDLAYGEYAVSMYHDEDMSGRLEKTVEGLPKEGVGLSNSPSGPPDFKKSAFTLKSPEMTVEIGVAY